MAYARAARRFNQMALQLDLPRVGRREEKDLLRSGERSVERFGLVEITLSNLDPGAADLIQEDLATGEKQGYKFTISASPTGYVINATPVSFGTSGSRTFFSDQSMMIRQNFGQEPATVTSPIFGK